MYWLSYSYNFNFNSFNYLNSSSYFYWFGFFIIFSIIFSFLTTFILYLGTCFIIFLGIFYIISLYTFISFSIGTSTSLYTIFSNGFSITLISSLKTGSTFSVIRLIYLICISSLGLNSYSKLSSILLTLIYNVFSSFSFLIYFS